jgi:uncharacterized membrane protein YozB (DUF420 family)
MALLVSHEAMSFAAFPLVPVTLLLATGRRFKDHRSVARATRPIWLYSTTTGIAIYVALYVL